MTLEKLQTIEPISLDIYNTNIKSINAKQLDSKSRFVRISCTEHGKKIKLDKNSTFSYVRFKKPDGKAVLNFCTILSDGTLVFELTQQMLLVSGKAVADIMLFEAKVIEDNNDNIELPEDFTKMNGFTVTYDETTDDVNIIFNKEDDLTHTINSIEDIERINLPLLSTMTLYVNVLPTTINHSEIESSHEYEALVEGLGKLGAISIYVENEEKKRQTQEQNRQSEEFKRNEKFNEVIGECNTAKENANTQASRAETAANDVRDVISDYQEVANNVSKAVEQTEKAVKDANDAVDKCNTIINKGIVLQSEKGEVNGVATLDADAKIPVEQLNIALAKIKVGDGDNEPETTLGTLLNELQNSINSIPKVYYGTNDPNAPDNPSVVGSKNGDIYMMIIEDNTEMVGE